MKQGSFYKILFKILNAKYAPAILILFCIVSLVAAQFLNDMNLFASSGAVMTIFGLISMIKFTTIEKYLNKEQIIAASTGMTGAPLSQSEQEEYVKRSQEQARQRITKELNSELKGISLSILGTLIWAYGAYIPLLGLENGT